MCIDRRYHVNEHDLKYNPEHYSRRYDDLLALIRLVGPAPLSATWSQSSSQAKGNEKPGVQGQRILHCFDAPREYGRTEATPFRPMTVRANVDSWCRAAFASRATCLRCRLRRPQRRRDSADAE
eukprot:6577250-Pyramimonas_sp.AAC.1